MYTYPGLQICKILDEKSRGKREKNAINEDFYPQRLSNSKVINISTNAMLSNIVDNFPYELNQTDLVCSPAFSLGV